jgi:hypothetical protein
VADATRRWAVLRIEPQLGLFGESYVRADTRGWLDDPESAVELPSGELLVTDTCNHRLQVLSYGPGMVWLGRGRTCRWSGRASATRLEESSCGGEGWI